MPPTPYAIDTAQLLLHAPQAASDRGSALPHLESRCLRDVLCLRCGSPVMGCHVRCWAAILILLIWTLVRKVAFFLAQRAPLVRRIGLNLVANLVVAKLFFVLLV